MEFVVLDYFDFVVVDQILEFVLQGIPGIFAEDTLQVILIFRSTAHQHLGPDAPQGVPDFAGFQTHVGKTRDKFSHYEVVVGSFQSGFYVPAHQQFEHKVAAARGIELAWRPACTCPQTERVVKRQINRIRLQLQRGSPRTDGTGTGGRHGRRRFRARLGGRLGITTVLWLWGATVALAQDLPGGPGAFHLYLVPAEARGIDLLAHVVEVEVVQHPDSTAHYHTVATYWLHNTTAEPRILDLTLRAAAGGLEGPGHGRLQRIQLFAATLPVPLEPLDNGQYQALVALASDERTGLELRYTVHAPGRYFPEVVYDSVPLRAWGAPPASMRLSVYAASELSPRTLQQATPVAYDLLSGEVRWHFENTWPGSPLQVRFIHAATWDRIRQAEATGDQLALGRQFQTLYKVSPEHAPSKRQAFYDQALAALVQAVAQDPGQAHYSLTQLYRTQLLEGVLPGFAAYLEPMLRHARLGLDFLPPEAEWQRRDLTRWLVDGLEMRIAMASQRADWVMVKDALDEAERLSPGGIAPERIAEMRRNAGLQQALGLLHLGATEEAAALVGSRLDAAGYMPPAEEVPLFQSWLAAVVASPTSLTVTMEGSIAPPQTARLRAKLALLEQLTARAGRSQQLTWHMQEDADAVPSRRVLQLHWSASDAGQARQLAEWLGADADWILLQQILQTPWPQESVHSRWLAQDLIYEYTLDLKNTYRLWDAKARALEQDAIREASAGADGPEDAVRQFNYVNSAQAWRDLATNSVVLVSLQPDAADPVPTPDAWVATMDDPRLQVRIARHGWRMPHLLGLGSSMLVLLLGLATWLTRMRTVRLGPAAA